MKYPTAHQLWFLQTTLSQKAREHATYLLEDLDSFENVLKKLSEKFVSLTGLSSTYHSYTNTNSANSLSDTQVLSRYDIAHLRQKPLSLYAPLALQYKGNPNLLSKKIVGIVGSRHPTYYGRIQAQKFARELSRSGCIVLSGGAIGVDAVANLYALDSQNGGSISVIGNGIQRPYPTSNHKLFHRLVNSKNGLILSEFKTDAPAQKWNFPQRNSTIAELCDFLLVIEATQTSGSLMTAKFAQECGKAIGALPGNIDNPNTSGSHQLIQNGAYCIHKPEDIFQYL